MRTIIFATNDECEELQSIHIKAEIFRPNKHGAVDLLKHLNASHDATAIVVGDVLVMGWCTYHPTHVLFSPKYSKNENTRIQALARVRAPKEFSHAG